MSNLYGIKTSQIDRAKKYLEQIRERGAVASRNALILMIALLVIWLSGLEPMMNQVQIEKQNNIQVEKLENELISIQKDQKILIKDQNEINKKIKQLESIPQELSSDTEASKTLIKTANERKDELEDRKDQLDKRKKEVKSQKDINEDDKVAFKTPLFEVALPINLAPLVWSILMSGLVLYLALMRSAMLSLYAKAKSILKSPNSTDLDLDPEIKRQFKSEVQHLKVFG